VFVNHVTIDVTCVVVKSVIITHLTAVLIVLTLHTDSKTHHIVLVSMDIMKMKTSNVKFVELIVLLVNLPLTTV